MLSVSPSPADRGRQETWLAVTPHDRGPFGPVLRGPYEAPSGFLETCVPIPSGVPLRSPHLCLCGVLIFSLYSL